MQKLFNYVEFIEDIQNERYKYSSYRDSEKEIVKAFDKFELTINQKIITLIKEMKKQEEALNFVSLNQKFPDPAFSEVETTLEEDLNKDVCKCIHCINKGE